MSWVHINDLEGIMLHAAALPDIHGTVNGVSPEPVTNRVFSRILGGALHRPVVLQVPACLLKMAIGEFATVLLDSQRVVPERICEAGYTFSFPYLTGALADLL